MTRTANARVAGVTYFVYIAAGISTLALRRPEATRVLTVVMSLSAMVLGVTLYAVTRDDDRDLAMMAMACRILEAVPDNDQTGAVFFAAGSTLFCYLLLRGRMIPTALAWLGVVVSPLLFLTLMLQRAGVSAAGANWASSLTWAVWLPMLVFELTLAFWFLTRGVAMPGMPAAVRPA